MNRQAVKNLAKKHKLKIGELLAMSSKNDPFYVGSDADWRDANWFMEKVWYPAGYTSGVHLRRAHYRCVSLATRLPIVIKQGKNTFTDVYLNTEASWKFLCRAAKMARYLGLVDISQIIDRKNPPPIDHMDITDIYENNYSVIAYDPDEAWIKTFHQSAGDLQPWHIELWSEKSTMNDIFEPIAEAHNLILCTFQGESSIPAANDFVERVKKSNKPAIIFYISDHDPAGLSMPRAVARKIEKILDDRALNLHIRLQPVALTPEQVVEYEIPRTPLKEKEVRAGVFEEKFGEGGAELDALEAIHPGLLKELITDKLYEYWSEEAHNRAAKIDEEIERRIQVEIDKIRDEYKEQIAAVKPAFRKLRDIEVDVDDLWVDDIALVYDIDIESIEENDDAMFDSRRSYLEQILKYKEWSHEEVTWKIKS